MLETHPFPPFVPPNTKYLLLGSFVGRPVPGYDWYYSSKRNQFWKILEHVYHNKLGTKQSKQQLFSRLHLAVTDIIYQCERCKNNNSDINLVNIIYNISALEKILSQNQIQTIFFTSRYVGKKFTKLFPQIKIKLITLPSPSPRYAKLDLKEKVYIYRKILPVLK
jgi:hypoxanthine-DNA glycosylase